MSHPIRMQSISGIRFYRMGRTLIADRGELRFVAHQYSTGGWEARWQPRKGLQMPVGGSECKTLRDAIRYLEPEYRRAQSAAIRRTSLVTSQDKQHEP